MKKLILLFLPLFINAQNVEIGSWKDYLSYHSASYISESKNKLYCVTNGALFYIDKTTESLNRVSKVTGLSDINIEKVAYSNVLDITIITYSNCNVDLLKNDEIINIPDIKRKEITGVKKINNITIKDNIAYLSTSFGLILLDLENFEIKDTYGVGEINESIQINGCAFLGDSIIVAASNGIYTSNPNNANLSDYNAWVLDTSTYSQKNYENIIISNNEIYVDSSVDVISISYNNNHFIQIFSDSISINNSTYITNDKFQNLKHAWIDNDLNLWIADSINGILKFTDGIYEKTYLPEGPIRNEIYSVEFIEDNLYQCHGGHKNFGSNSGINDGVSIKNNYDEWVNYDRYTLGNSKDILEVAAKNGIQYYASWNNGISEMQGENLIIKYTYENTGGALDTTYYSQNRIRISDLKFDSNGNLWGLSSEVNNPLFVKTLDNNWFSFSMNQDRVALFFDDLIIDQNNQKWGIIGRGGGVFVYNENYTIENPLDDQYKILTTNIGYGNLPSSWVYSIAEDLNGEIWIGSDKGIAVFYNPEDVFSGYNFDAQQILIQQGDYGQYLLSEEKIKCIAIDKANRKWIGTEKSGVFLLSEDGLDQVLHFTAENSPLFSNNIIDICINDKNGEVFIGTESGLISYRSDATSGSEIQAETHVFPNPVRDSYSGPIAIDGLVENANIKITDVDGNLIFEGKANGGQAIWNGKNKYNERASTGVYLVFSVNLSGQEKMVSKILFIH